MNRKLTAAFMIAAAVLGMAAFTGLGSAFNYPDVLNEPAGEVLAKFHDSQGVVSGWFVVLAAAAALFVPIAIGVGRLSRARAMRIAVPVGIAAGVVQVIGLLRWPLLVPGYAAHAASTDPATAAAARDSFDTANQVLGTVIGESFGYVLTAAWTSRHRRPPPLLRRPLVQRRRLGLRGARRRRCALTPGAARHRHRQLRRLRPVDPVARRVRRAAPRPALPPPDAGAGPCTRRRVRARRPGVGVTPPAAQPSPTPPPTVLRSRSCRPKRTPSAPPTTRPPRSRPRGSGSPLVGCRPSWASRSADTPPT